MLQIMNTTTQTLLPGQSITFDKILLQSGNGECCPCNAARVMVPKLKQCGAIYEVGFDANVTGATADTQVQMAIAMDGVALPETVRASTPSVAGSYNGISSTTLVKNCCGTTTVTVMNSGTNNITVYAGANLRVKRLS